MIARWRLVPVEPTREMTDALERNEAYCDSCKGTSFDSVNGYDDMLEAAPPASKDAEFFSGLVRAVYEASGHFKWVDRSEQGEQHAIRDARAILRFLEGAQ